MRDMLRSKLWQVIIHEQWTPAQKGFLTDSEAIVLLSKIDFDYSVEQHENVIVLVKRLCTQLQKIDKSHKKQEEADRNFYNSPFYNSSAAKALRRHEKNSYNIDRSLRGRKDFVSKILNSYEAAILWFFRQSDGVPVPGKILTEIERHCSPRLVFELLDGLLMQPDIVAARELIDRINSIKLMKVKYRSRLECYSSSVDAVEKLKERLSKEPLEFVPQAEFTRDVMLNNNFFQFMSESLFRGWMQKFVTEGLIEQIKVGGRFQFRSSYSSSNNSK